ncbi:MAG: hypothetical protein IT460_06205 [Planctomycetes bacterium]|nr:hypothetical protein [Planctomycetota bacterium]
MNVCFRGRPAAESLTFEPLGYEHGRSHGFIGNSLEKGKDYVERRQLPINEQGRFAELAACERAVESTRRDATGAEPVLRQPWHVVEVARATA